MTDKQPRFRFNPEISMGHVMQFIAMIMAVLAAYFTLDQRLALLEDDNGPQKLAVDKVIQIETRLQMMETQHSEDQALIRRDLQRIENKLDRLIERSD